MIAFYASSRTGGAFEAPARHHFRDDWPESGFMRAFGSSHLEARRPGLPRTSLLDRNEELQFQDRWMAAHPEIALHGLHTRVLCQ